MNTIDTFDRNEVIKMAQECGLVIAEPANGALSEIWSGVSSLALEVLCNKAAELERARLMQIFTDPANQPSQFGTATLESVQMEEGHCMCPACNGGVIHLSDCAVHNEPAMPAGPCDCKREEAQTVEPILGSRYGSPEMCELIVENLKKPTVKQSLSVEREALISAMNMYAAAYPDSKHFRRVAVMLAADAQQVAVANERKL